MKTFHLFEMLKGMLVGNMSTANTPPSRFGRTSRGSSLGLTSALTVGSPSVDRRENKVLPLAVLLLFLICGVGQVWGADPSWSHTFTSAPSVSNNKVTISNAEWSVATTTGKGSPTIGAGSDNSVSSWKFGSGANHYYSNITLSTNYFADYNVKSVYIVGCSNNANKTVTITATQGSGGSAVTIGTASITKAYASSWHTSADCQKTMNTNQGSGGTLTISINPDACAFSIRQITVTYSAAAPTKCATPALSLDAGTYTGSQSVTLSCSTTDATIRYTTDGSTPTSTSTVYSSAISVGQTTTIKAKAFKDDLTASDEASATYTIKCEAPTFTKSAGTYDNDFSVELSTTFGTSIYYTTDGSTPTASSTLYSGAITVSASQTIKAIAVKANCVNSTVGSAAYTLKCAQPSLGLSAGTYEGNQSVTLSCSTADAVIRYTLDGSDPSENSDVYSAAINIPVTKTLKARAFKTGYTTSNLGQATYTIKCAAPTSSPAAGTFTGPQDISLSTTYGEKIYYTISTTSAAAATPTTSSTEYTEPIHITTTTKIKAISVKDGCTNSNQLSGTYTIQYRVRWHDNEGQISEGLVNSGSTTYSCPSDPNPSERGNCGDRFMGWTNAPYVGSNAPAVLFTSSTGTKPAITGDTDFYAVFADYVEK